MEKHKGGLAVGGGAQKTARSISSKTSLKDDTTNSINTWNSCCIWWILSHTSTDCIYMNNLHSSDNEKEKNGQFVHEVYSL